MEESLTQDIMAASARRVLDNGLVVAVVPLPHLHQAHLSCVFNVGSRYEEPELNGISHFLEHMMFRGTRRLPSLTAISAAFDTGRNFVRKAAAM